MLFPDYGAVVSRGKDNRGNIWEFAAKGGNNEEHHNHNDCGSFILNFNGMPALMEIGAPEYVHGYFSPEMRYTFLPARSLGHSVPYVNGCEQPAGKEFAATVVACEIETESLKFVVDLTKCYPVEARCSKLIRTFDFEKTAGLLRIADAYELESSEPVESILICEAAISLENGMGTIHAPGGKLRLVPGKGTCFSDVEVAEYHDHGGHLRQINRLRFRPTDQAQRGVIQFEIQAANLVS